MLSYIEFFVFLKKIMLSSFQKKDFMEKLTTKKWVEVPKKSTA